MTEAYTVQDHTYDVVVVGGGGSGLRAVLGCVQAGLKTACVTKVFPTRSHTVAAQGGIAASLGNMSDDNWHWHMYDTVKGSDWLGDQDAIEYMCREAPPAVIELEHYGVPFSAHRRGQDLPAPVRRPSMQISAKARRPAHLRRRRPHRPRHPAHALPAVAEAQAEFFIEYFRHRPDHGRAGACRASMAWNWTTARIHRFRRTDACWRPAAMAALFLGTSAHTCTGDGSGMVARAGLPLQDMEFVQFHPTGIYGPAASSPRARAAKAAILTQLRRRAVHGALRADGQGPGVARRGRRSMTMEIREGRGVGARQRPHLPAPRTSAPEVLHERLPGIYRDRAIFAGVDATKEPIPVLPTVHYNMGGIPTNYHGEVLRPTDGDPDAIVPGLMAVGEAGLRLGARRQPARLQLAARPGGVRPRRRPALRRDAQAGRQADKTCRRTRARRRSPVSTSARYAKGSTGTAEIRARVQRSMQARRGVPRAVLAGGRLPQGWSNAAGAMDDCGSPTAR